MYVWMMFVTSDSKWVMSDWVNSVAAARRVSLSADGSRSRRMYSIGSSSNISSSCSGHGQLRREDACRSQRTPDGHVRQNDLLAEQLESVRSGEHLAVASHLDNDRQELERARHELYVS